MSSERSCSDDAAAEQIRAIWSRFFDADAPTDLGFLGLGGHSLMAVRLVAAIRKETGMVVPLPALMRQDASVADVIELARDGASQQPPHRRAARVQPLLSSQLAIWTDQQLKNDRTVYAVVGALEVQTRIDPEMLTAALQRVIARHDALRARVERFASGPALVFDPKAPPASVTLFDSTVSVREAAESLRHELADDASAPLMRVGLIPDAGATTLVVALNHLISDAESLDLLFAELSDAYGRGGAGPVAQGPSFAKYMEERRRSEAAQREPGLAYWRSTLGTRTLAAPIPLAGSARGSEPEQAVAILPQRIAREAIDKLAAHRFTAATALLAATATVLGRSQAADEVVLGVPTSQRFEEEQSRIIGMALGVLPLTIPASGPAADRLSRTRDAWLDGVDHAVFDLGTLVRQLGHHDPRVSGLSVWVNDLTHRRPPSHFAGAAARYVDSRLTSPLFPLSVYLSEVQGALEFNLITTGEIFVDPGMLEELAQQIRDVFVALAGLPPQTEPQFVSAVTERGHSAPGVSATAAVGTSLDQDSVPQLMRFGDTALERNQIEHWTRRITDHVAQALPDPSVVLLRATRSAALLPTLLALWGNGHTVAVVDAALPEQAWKLRATLAGAVVALTVPTTGPPASPTLSSLRTVADVADRDLATVADGAASTILFTTGTTGVPRPVWTPVTSLIEAVDDYLAAIEVPRSIRTGLLGGLGHDPMLRDLLVPVLRRGELHIPPADVTRDPRKLFSFVHGAQLTLLHTTPALSRILAAGATDVLPDLTAIVCGGDALTPDDVDDLYRIAPNAQVWNAYGATESSQIASLLKISPPLLKHGAPHSIPIGRACGKSRVSVQVDGRGVLPGELGHVHIESPYLGANLPQQPFNTGDLGRIDTRGYVYLAGRRDRQISVGGHRVSPHTAETLVRTHPMVRQAWAGLDAAARDTYTLAVQPRTDPRGDVITTELVADLRRLLTSGLAPFEVPGRVLLVKDFALDYHHKVVGPGRAWPTTTLSATPPASAGEAEIIDLVDHTFGIALSPAQNFFDGGLTSLHLLQLHEKLRERTSFGVTALDLFEYPNARALVAHLAGQAVSSPSKDQPSLGPTAAQEEEDPATRRRRAREALYRTQE